MLFGPQNDKKHVPLWCPIKSVLSWGKCHHPHQPECNWSKDKSFFMCFAGDVSTAVALQSALKFNGGGHINHSIFWTNLSPNGGGEPTGNFRIYLFL